MTTTSGLTAPALDGHRRLLEHLSGLKVPYRHIAHPPEGRTDRASAIRGHPLGHAAKCLVLEVRYADGRADFVNCVVPGDRRVDFPGVCRLLGAASARMASAERAAELTGCPMGAVTPFSFHPDLRLIADPGLFAVPELVFNAGRLDTSVALTPADYLAAARPRVSFIAA